MRDNKYQNEYVNPCNNFNTAIADGNFPASTAYIDTTNYTHFAFKVRAGTLDSALTLQVKQDTSATETASIKNVTGATVTVGAGDDNELFLIEVETSQLDIANSFRYVTLAVSGAAGGNDYADILFEGWNARHRTVTQPATYPAANAVLIAG
jgi:hypothetical protein